MEAMDARRRPTAAPLFLVTQFIVCVVCWTIVVLIIEGAVSQAGFIASVVTGVVLVAVTVVLVRFGLITAPQRRRMTPPPA